MGLLHLTDDELWRAIAENTNSMSELIDRQLEIADEIAVATPAHRAKLVGSDLEMINRYQREYRDYTTELRRRHSIAEVTGRRIVAELAKRILSYSSARDIFAPAQHEC